MWENKCTDWPEQSRLPAPLWAPLPVRRFGCLSLPSLFYLGQIVIPATKHAIKEQSGSKEISTTQRSKVKERSDCQASAKLWSWFCPSVSLSAALVLIVASGPWSTGSCVSCPFTWTWCPAALKRPARSGKRDEWEELTSGRPMMKGETVCTNWSLC